MAGEPAPRLQLVGSPEHVSASASTALAVRQGGVLVCHDVNGYYAALRVSPTATRRELTDAYRERGGPNDAWLTHCFQQLHNRQTRAIYDARPPGQPLVDRYIVDDLRRQASLHVAAGNARTGGRKTAEDILKSLGIEGGDPFPASLDSEDSDRFDDVEGRNRQSSPQSKETSPYAYLLLDSACDDVDRLTHWQIGLGLALSHRGFHRHYAVGFHATSEQPYLVVDLGGTPALFLHEAWDVTEELIAAAATAAAG